jgi:signal transduction histidine kinase
MKRTGKPKRKKSLLIHYLFIVLLAVMLWPMILPVSVMVYYAPSLLDNWTKGEQPEKNPYESRKVLTDMWHAEALKLDGAAADEVDRQLALVKERLPKARIFWVDGEGTTRLKLPEQPVPDKWTAVDSIAFMKQSYGAEPFTVVAFIGQKPEQGFMVLQVDSKLIEKVNSVSNEFLAITLSLVFLVFLFLSISFFYRIRKRLLRLEEAMSTLDGSGIPHLIQVKREDEIGQLEHAFNRMIGELNTGRAREEKEEALRKQLIANLSHDLRTPLTIIRSHAYSLRTESLTDKARQSLALIEVKSDDLNRLIDNLLSYSLLTAGKYPLERQPTDMVRLLRMTAAGWYPVLESEGFEINVSLPEHAVYWAVDPGWMTRILDNLLQNVVRHAKSGGYVGILLEECEVGSVIVLEDKGPGFEAVSGEKGAGIGLEIVALMVKELGLAYTLESRPGRTRISIMGPAENS